MPEVQQSIRIGHGYDLHRLEPHPPEGNGKPFVLGGERIDHPLGPVGHSDGDALLHAVTDALLGALCEPDIGQLFPDDDPYLDEDTVFGCVTLHANTVAEKGSTRTNA